MYNISEFIRNKCKYGQVPKFHEGVREMNARKYIEEALIDLLDKKSIDKIKVSEVIREVGTCKGTFYKYYCDKYALLQRCFENRVYAKVADADFETFMRQCLEEFAKIPRATVNAFDSRDVNSLKYYHEALIVARLKTRAQESGVDVGRTELMSMQICAAGCTEIMLQWLKSGAKETVDELITYMNAAVPGAIVSVRATA